MSNLLADFGSASVKWRRDRERQYIEIVQRHAEPRADDGEILAGIARDLDISAGDVSRDVQFLQKRARLEIAVPAAQEKYDAAEKARLACEELLSGKIDPIAIGGAIAWERATSANAQTIQEARAAVEIALNELIVVRNQLKELLRETPHRLSHWA